MLRLFPSLLLFLASPLRADPLPTVALTFDHYALTYTTAFPILQKCGVVGTFFVDPDQIGVDSPNAQ
jgi:peptidoglycan/xylan/chitin deacetylase (PgdA/CDA1 family)